MDDRELATRLNNIEQIVTQIWQYLKEEQDEYDQEQEEQEKQTGIKEE